MIPWKGSFVFLVRGKTIANHCQSSLFFIKISGKNCKKKDSHLAANPLCTLVATGEDTPLQFISHTVLTEHRSPFFVGFHGVCSLESFLVSFPRFSVLWSQLSVKSSSQNCSLESNSCWSSIVTLSGGLWLVLQHTVLSLEVRKLRYTIPLLSR